MSPRRLVRPAVVLSVIAVGLAACGDAEGDSADADGLTIVASTNVYGDVASAVAGDLATVTSIVTSPDQDPHEYEASAQDRLAFDGADVVVKNGGGYDPFVDTLLEGGGDPVVLDAVEISGLASEEGEEGEEHADEEHADEEHADEEHADEEHADEDGHDHIEGFNEHVWYDFHAVEKLAEELSRELGELDPDNAATYEDNLGAFIEQLEALEARAEELHEANEGRQAMITEPVPVYLLAEVGLDDITPDEFSEAVEEGADVPPRALQETLDLLAEQEVALLAYNAQTDDATTEQVRAAAEEAGVPVVDFTETLPEGRSYVEWQQSNLDALAEVLG